MNTELICILDRSGSMESIRDDAEGGFNRFIEEQKAAPGECKVTVMQFDHEFETMFAAVPISDVPRYNLLARGSTALLDAIGRTLASQAERIKNEAWAQLVIVLVVTDGLENASKEYTIERVQEMVRHAERHGWTFIWQAAGIDAFSVAKHLGSAGTLANTVDHSAAGMATASVYYSTAVLNKRMGLSDEDAAEAASLAASNQK